MMVFGVPNEYSAEVAKYVSVRNQTACWNWTGHMDQYGKPSYRVMCGETWLYLTPRIAMYEAQIGCNLLKAVALSPVCRNKLCCNPGHMTPVQANVKFVRSFANLHNRVQIGGVAPPPDPGFAKVNGSDTKREPADVVGSMLRHGANVHDIAYVSGWSLDSIRRMSALIKHVWRPGQRDPKVVAA